MHDEHVRYVQRPYKPKVLGSTPRSCTVDLHGVQRDEVFSTVDHALNQAFMKDVDLMYLITGKGKVVKLEAYRVLSSHVLVDEITEARDGSGYKVLMASKNGDRL